MRDIPGHEGRYAINENGTKLWSYPKPKKMMQGCIGWTKGKFLSIRPINRGYWHVTLSVKDEKGRRPVSYPVHRLVALSFIGSPLPHQTEVNHKDKNPSNNHYSNLEWVTRLENIQHSWATGKKMPKWKIGRINLPHTLTIEQIKEIYKLIKNKVAFREIARKFGMAHSAVLHIKQRKGCYSLSLKELEKRMKVKNSDVILPPPAQTR